MCKHIMLVDRALWCFVNHWLQSYTSALLQWHWGNRMFHDDITKGKHFPRYWPYGDRWIPLTKTSDAELGCLFDLRLNKRLNKQSRRRWFETQPRSLWRHCNIENATFLCDPGQHVLKWLPGMTDLKSISKVWTWLIWTPRTPLLLWSVIIQT